MMAEKMTATKKAKNSSEHDDEEDKAEEDESVHDALVRNIKEAGLEQLATTLKVMQEGKLPALANDKAAEEKMSTLLGKRAESKEGKTPGSRSDQDAGFAQNQRKRRRDIVTKRASSSGSHESGSMRNGPRRQVTAAQVLRAIREGSKITYQDVASQLITAVRTAVAPSGGDEASALRNEEEKSLRRSIYDVVNVLIAMGLVDKDQNVLTCTAEPQSTEREFVMLDKERRDVLDRIADKQAQLHELMLQTAGLHNLAQRNKKLASQGKAPTSESEKVALPFVVVSTDKSAVIECEMAESRTDIVLNMSEPFKIHDDTEIIKRLKLHEADAETLRKLFPEALHPLIPSMRSKAEPA